MINYFVFAVMLFILPRITTLPYSMPRTALLAMGAVLVVAVGISTPAPSMPLPLLIGLGMVFVLMISTMASPRQDIAFKYAFVFFGAVALSSAATPRVLTLMVMAAVIHSVVIIVQDVTGKYDLIDPGCSGAGAMFGNTALAGTYLAPHVFLAIHTGDLLAVPVIVTALVITRCRGGLLGVLAGVVALQPWAVLPAAVVGLAIVYINRGRGLSSMHSRRNAWKLMAKHVTPRVLAIGLGGDVGRTVFAANPYANNESTNYLRAHSDVIQAVFDGGVLLAAGYLAASLSTVWISSSGGQPQLAAAMISLMVGGLFLHGQHVSVILLTFWCIAGQSAPHISPTIAPGPANAIAAVVLAAIWWLTWGRALFADMAFRRWQRTDSMPALIAANGLQPKNGPINVVIAVIGYNRGMFREGLRHATAAIRWFDGDAYLPTAHHVAGLCSLKLNDKNGAISNLDRACELDPDDKRYAADLWRAVLYKPTRG